MTRRSRSHFPDFIDLLPVGPTTTPATGPLALVATDAELREMTVTDPVVGDAISCADLIIRDGACWDDANARWPPRVAYARSPSDRQRAAAERGLCRRRGRVLLYTCRVGGVRAG